MLNPIAWGIGIYPVVAHLGLWTSHPRLAVGYLFLLVLLVLLYPPRYSGIRNVISAAFLVIGMISLIALDLDYLLVYLPPVVIPSMLMLLFIQSLRTGNVPLITRFAQMTQGEEISDERKIYTRQVTIVWTSVFGFMILEGLIAALWTSIETWSWITHIGNYAIIATVLIIEFIYRKHRFDQDSGNFKQFIMALVKHRWS